MKNFVNDRPGTLNNLIGRAESRPTTAQAMASAPVNHLSIEQLASEVVPLISRQAHLSEEERFTLEKLDTHDGLLRTVLKYARPC